MQEPALASLPLVSVVVPSFNHQRFIAAALDSVLNQSYPELELIVIDDGSSDGSPQLLSTRYGSNSRVRLTLRENRGAHATINEGITQARGPLLSILNSDDLYEPERLARLVQCAQEHARAHPARPFFAYSGVSIVDEQGHLSTRGAQPDNYATLLSKYQQEPGLPFFWIGNLAMTTSNFFFSRSLFEQVGPFAPLRYLHDWDWALRAQQHTQVLRLPEPLLRYRTHGANTISERKLWKRVAESAYVFATALQRQAQAGGHTPERMLTILARNKSFAPIPVLFLLGLGASETQLWQMLEQGQLEALMPQLIGSATSDEGLVRSVPHLRGKLAEAQQGLAQSAWRRLKKRGARVRRRLLERARGSR